MTALNRYNPTEFPTSTYDTDAIHATDVTVGQAITDMNAAWMAYLATQEGVLTVSPLLGQNLDFEEPEGTVSYTPTDGKFHSYDQPSWNLTVTNTGNTYTFAGQTTDVYEGYTTGTHSLRVYSNWTEPGDVLQYTQSTMLPSGSYRVEMSLKMVNQKWSENLSYVKAGDTTYPITAGSSWEKVSVNIELIQPTLVTVSLGHKAQGGDNKMEIYVDDINMYVTAKTAYERAHEAAVTAQSADGTSGSVALASALAEYEATTQTDAVSAGYDVVTATAVLNNAVAIAEAGDNATSLLKNADFTRESGSGNLKYPSDWTFTHNFSGWNDCKVENGVFNMWAGTINSSELKQQMTNLPDGIYEISADFKNDILGGKSGIGIFADGTGTNTGRSVDVGTYSGNKDDFFNYSAVVRIQGHKMNVGIYSNKGYYRAQNLQVKMLADNEENSAKVANSVMYQDICWNRGQLEYNIAGNDKYADAVNADIRAMLNEPNALITAKAGQIKAGDNVIVGGTCEKLVVTDGAPFKTSTEFTATEATYTRTMPTADETTYTWGTVMLPYEVQSSAGIKFYALTEAQIGNNSGLLKFKEVNKLEANTPGVFVSENASAVMTGNGTVPASPTSLAEFTTEEVTDWKLNGTLSQVVIDDVSTDEANDYYYIANDKFWHATQKVTLNPFRAYFTAPKTVNSVRAFSLVIDDSDATSIELVPVAEGEQTIYTLSGVRIQGKVESLKPGIYIINNRKTVVK